MKLSNCKRCDLWKTRTKVVFGRGPKNPKIVFVGEAPGKDEDIVGKPFVGRAGKLLRKLIKVMGLKRREVYITNVLLCRPPNNRIPDILEINACKKRLLASLKRFDCPIVCLGRVASETIIGRQFKWGIWYEASDHKKVIATFHPSYYLHRGGGISDGVVAFKRISRFLKKNTKENAKKSKRYDEVGA